MIELVAFLGNPGRKYTFTRHNAGRLLAEKHSFFNALSWKAKFKGLWADMESSRLPPVPNEAALLPIPQKIHFLMPETFMNLSGEPVLAAASFFKIPIEKILVVHDELELPLGVVSLKFQGGLGGHNGLRSMKACFSSVDFWRLRIGIGRPDDREPGKGGHEGSGQGIVDWVLSDFSQEETQILEQSLEAAASLLSGLLLSGPETFLPEWSKKKTMPGPNLPNTAG
jgi:PTH1 family peptidyl-tRNA hydrolase